MFIQCLNFVTCCSLHIWLFHFQISYCFSIPVSWTFSRFFRMDNSFFSVSPVSLFVLQTANVMQRQVMHTICQCQAHGPRVTSALMVIRVQPVIVVRMAPLAQPDQEAISVWTHSWSTLEARFMWDGEGPHAQRHPSFCMQVSFRYFLYTYVLWNRYFMNINDFWRMIL